MTVMIVCCATMAACKNDTAQVDVRYGDGTVPVKLLRHYSGSDAGFKDPAVKLINSRQQLVEMGSVDLIDRGFDFSKESVLLLALGEQPTSGYRAWITGVQYSTDGLFVQGSANRPTEKQIIMNMLTYPYDAVVIKKVPPGPVRSEIESVSGQRNPFER